MAKESNNIKKEFKRLRKNLLDLSSRNQLLNFKPRSRTIEVENHSPSSIYQSLILQKKTLKFIANKKAKSNSKFDNNGTTDNNNNNIDNENKIGDGDNSTNNNNINNKYNNNNGDSQDKGREIWRIPKLDLKIFGDNNKTIKTNLTATELQKRLFYINQQAKMMLQEQGYNILYIAIGFLEWKGGFKPNEVKKAPLILIPVTLERKKIGKSFSLYWNEEEIQTNISLRAKLKDEGIILPEFELAHYSESVNHYISKVKDLTSKISGWNVSNDIAIGFFSFTKFIMYKDLNPESWDKGVDLTQNEIMGSIFNPKSISHSELFSEEDIDKIPYSSMYNVLDSDSSQTAVIENVKAGHNLVVEGPPGTGKSQTIVNLIAELIASGKTVLFVSEKMAALEVVKGRLESVGLGKFVLEIHSHKTRRKALLKDLERCLHHKKDKKLDLEEKFNRLDSLRNQLNQYGEILKEPYFAIGLSPYELYGMKEYCDEYFSKKDTLMPLVKFTNPESTTKADLDNIIIELESLAELYSTINMSIPNKDNPWTNCNPGNLLPSDLREINILINDTLRGLNEFRGDIQLVNERFGINTDSINTLKGFKHSIEAMKLFEPGNIKYIRGDVLKYIANNLNSSISSINTDSNDSKEHNSVGSSSRSNTSNGSTINNDNLEFSIDLDMSSVIKKLDDYKTTKKYYDKFNNNINNYDIDKIISKYRNVVNSTKFKLFSSKYKGIKNEIASLYNEKYKNNLPSDNNILNDLIGVKEHISVKKDLMDSENIYKKVFGELWDLNVDINELHKVTNWINQLNTFIKEGIFSQSHQSTVSENFINFLSNVISNVFIEFNVEIELNDYMESGNEFESNLRKLKSKLNARSSLIFKKETEDVSFDKWENQLNDWKNQLSLLHLWSQYLEVKNKCENGLSHDFIGSIEKYSINKKDVKHLVNGNFADALLNIIFYENPELSSFVGDLHENRIAEFKELDTDIIELNRQRIYYGLNSKIPEVYGNSEDPESKVLAGEFVRKQGHLPVRTLLEKSGGLIKQIKPVFMMSPLSVAQYLDPTNSKLQFDVVIFDEASQVKPEDALGAFLRGKTGVVMGDTQQLPPTSFFDQMTNSESGEEVATALDMESILHLCKLSFPVIMLKWHYRSRHESLIAVSNQEFYDNQLLIYPSPSSNTESLGLKFNYNPNTKYDRGKSSSNREEAKDVVVEVFKHFERYGDTKSLGVGTFSVAQMNAILEELELERKNHPELEHLFSDQREDRFFVKNLETIQGDERDVILISIGYGFDLNGNIGLNFGPLNQEGGERRLNVLITRAKEKCVVFSNFKAYDMNLTANPPFGVKALKRFLEYAENTSKGVATNDNKEKEPFVDAVATFLRSKGYEVDTQVGCAGFRVDLAIIDNETQGRYVLGIECDGPSYSFSRVARDRDRLRDQVLTGLGWNIYHLWSTDWYRNRDLDKEKLISKIEEMKIKVVEEDERVSKELENLKKAREEELARIVREAEEEKVREEMEHIEKVKKEFEDQEHTINSSDFTITNFNSSITPNTNNTNNNPHNNDTNNNPNANNYHYVDDGDDSYSKIDKSKNIISKYGDYVHNNGEGSDESNYTDTHDDFSDLEHPKIELDIETLEELDKELNKELDDGVSVNNNKNNNYDVKNITKSNGDNRNVNNKNNNNKLDNGNMDTNSDSVNTNNSDINVDNNNMDTDSIESIDNTVDDGSSDSIDILSIDYNKDQINKDYNTDANDLKVTFKKKIGSFVSIIRENTNNTSDINSECNSNINTDNITNSNEYDGDTESITNKSNINSNNTVDNAASDDIDSNNSNIIDNTENYIDNTIKNDDEYVDNNINTNPNAKYDINKNAEVEDDLEIEIKRYLESTEDSNINKNDNKYRDSSNVNNNINMPNINIANDTNNIGYENENIGTIYSEIKGNEEKYISGANINSSLRRNSTEKYRRPRKKSSKISEKIKSVPIEIKHIKNTLNEIENPTAPKEFFVIDRSDYDDENNIDDNTNNRDDNNNSINNNGIIGNSNTNINESISNNISNGSINNKGINDNNTDITSNILDDLESPAIVPYVIANNVNLKTSNIYEASPEEINSVINEVVLIEGPLHLSEVHTRLKEIYNVSRATPKFKNTINQVIKNISDSIILKEDFLFDKNINNDNIIVRKREKPNIDLISSEEIYKAIKIAINSDLGIDKDINNANNNYNLNNENYINNNELEKIVKEVAKYFGFKSTSAKTAKRIKAVINEKNII
ncbi:MAG: DUF4011 domain-containing protein [Methanobacteriaceae archaeon]